MHQEVRWLRCSLRWVCALVSHTLKKKIHVKQDEQVTWSKTILHGKNKNIFTFLCFVKVSLSKFIVWDALRYLTEGCNSGVQFALCRQESRRQGQLYSLVPVVKIKRMTGRYIFIIYKIRLYLSSCINKTQSVYILSKMREVMHGLKPYATCALKRPHGGAVALQQRWLTDSQRK